MCLCYLHLLSTNRFKCDLRPLEFSCVFHFTGTWELGNPPELTRLPSFKRVVPAGVKSQAWECCLRRLISYCPARRRFAAASPIYGPLDLSTLRRHTLSPSGGSRRHASVRSGEGRRSRSIPPYPGVTNLKPFRVITSYAAARKD